MLTSDNEAIGAAKLVRRAAVGIGLRRRQLGSSRETAGRRASIAASASELPPQVANARLWSFQGGNPGEETARDADDQIPPAELGVLWRGYDTAIDVVRIYYLPVTGPVALTCVATWHSADARSQGRAARGAVEIGDPHRCAADLDGAAIPGSQSAPRGRWWWPRAAVCASATPQRRGGARRAGKGGAPLRRAAYRPLAGAARPSIFAPSSQLPLASQSRPAIDLATGSGGGPGVMGELAPPHRLADSRGGHA